MDSGIYIHIRLLCLCWELYKISPFGLMKFILCNREPHSNQTLSGKFLHRYTYLVYGVCIQRVSLLIIGSYETDERGKTWSECKGCR